MKLHKTLTTMLLTGGLSYASSLAVYQDKTFYSYTPQNNFIGFSKGVKATCEGTTIPLSGMTHCPEESRLCKELTSLKSTEEKVEAVVANTKVLAQLVSLPQPTSFDAQAWIESAKLIGKEQARLLIEEKVLSEESELKQRNFQKQAPAQHVIQTSKSCSKEIELSIPYGYVSFSTRYEANIIDDKELTVSQYLSITNRSGIDIKADTAMFYYRSAKQYVYPTHFTPWIVSKYVPRPTRVRKSKKAMRKELSMNMAMMEEERVVSPMMDAAPVASYEDAREYKIQNLTLPSTGVALDVEVLTWKAALSCEIRAYPYVRRQAFHVCSFTPKHQIDANLWKVKSAEVVINENAAGEYRGEHYDLYTRVEENIKIERKAIVKRERETGIFGGTERKKDGFTLILTNKSDTEKTLTLTERIPTSSTEEIKVKLLSITSDKKVNYKALKDGQIEIKLALAPNETKKIEVLFEIAYDKDLKVSY
jgi:hypothetical protein